jgi:hypothetical protein
MQAVKRQDLVGAFRHQEVALKLTQFALQGVECEIAVRESHQRPLGPLLSMQMMYRDVEKCLVEQKASVERLVIVIAEIQAHHAGVVGKA